MRSRPEGPPAQLPHVVASGFTTAFLGDERTLREYVVGDHVVTTIRKQGGNAILYLINDSYDPLNERQLRIAVNKDPGLIERFRPFCGRPIAEIPDPYNCHASYSEHFAQALLERLHDLDIHAVLLDSYQAYLKGYYTPFIERTFANYREMQQQLSDRFDYTIRNLFRIQCPQCRCIDSVDITKVEGSVAYLCERCGLGLAQEPEALRGKLSWKLDCAARWNLYAIDTEVFAKAHLAEKGTLNSSRFVSEHFFGGRLPKVVRYGDLHISRDISGWLLRMLPARAIKKLMTEAPGTDLTLTRDYLEHFAHTFEVRPGLSYVEYVREELPRRALEVDRAGAPSTVSSPLSTERGERTLIGHANAFSEFYYGTRHGLRWPDLSAMADSDAVTIAAAEQVVGYAIALRAQPHLEFKELKVQLKSHLDTLPSLPGLYPLLRKLFGQERGPNVTTVLAILPAGYLSLVHFALQGHARASGVTHQVIRATDATHEEAA
jgi:hypothetical protein